MNCDDGEYFLPEDILDGIEVERCHQIRKWGWKPHDVGAWLTIMRAELQEAEQAWCKANSDGPALSEILQVVAVGVACMEQHGVVTRFTLQAATEIEEEKSRQEEAQLKAHLAVREYFQQADEAEADEAEAKNES